MRRCCLPRPKRIVLKTDNDMENEDDENTRLISKVA